MPTQHKLQATLDERTGQVTLEQRVFVEIMGQTVSHAEAVPIDPALEPLLRKTLEENRKGVDDRGLAMTVSHVAAVQRTPRRGVQQIDVGGTVGAEGGAQ